VPPEVKKDRIMRLVDIQNERNRVDSLKYVGKTIEVLIEDYDQKKKAYMGRDERGRMAYVDYNKNIIGKFVQVQITSTGGMSLHGKIIKVEEEI
jgi:tRNA-2-methylthio-N6-dimethylallyladenosine synthase